MALRELTGVNPKLAEALKKDHIDLETLTDIEVIKKIFWTTELFPVYADKSTHTPRLYERSRVHSQFCDVQTRRSEALERSRYHRYLFDVNKQYVPRTAQRKNNMLKRLLTYLHINQYHQHNLAFHVKNQKHQSHFVGKLILMRTNELPSRSTIPSNGHKKRSSLSSRTRRSGICCERLACGLQNCYQ